MTAASVAADTHIRPSEEVMYEAPNREPVREDDDDDFDDEYLEEDAKTFGRENVGLVASPDLMPYVYRRQFLTRHTVRVKKVIYLRMAIPRC